ncbi:MAG TPA: hypothetical protein VJ814_00525 [Gaiellaceae bacterium]|nr:hypothetical protein [Gaiellaceae bacterium]
MSATCHYCGDRQPSWRLRPLELSAAGPVRVCRDAEACRTRARVGVLVPTRAHKAPSARRRRRFLGRSGGRWAYTMTLLVLGVLVLPHIAVHGHHYRFWVIP